LVVKVFGFSHECGQEGQQAARTQTMLGTFAHQGGVPAFLARVRAAHAFTRTKKQPGAKVTGLFAQRAEEPGFLQPERVEIDAAPTPSVPPQAG
jgi:hypothetical protein